MKIRISDISDEGLTIEAHFHSDHWWENSTREAFESLLPQEADAHVEVTLVRNEDMISVLGEIMVPLRPHCDRCLEAFDKRFEISVQHYLLPAHSHGEAHDAKEVELDEEDLEFGTYSGKVIDLGEILREQMVLALPIRFLCRPSCKGLCSHCGINLNWATCTCHDEVPANPFDALKCLKS